MSRRTIAFVLAFALAIPTAALAKSQGDVVGAVLHYFLAPRDRRMEALHPELQEKLARVLSALESQGYQPFIRSGWRSAEYQDGIYVVGRLHERLGGPRYTRARGGQSCHNHTLDDGAAAATAADINDARARTLKDKAAFYRALGEAARAEGLTWGGDWPRRNKAWARHGLGWDPAHVQLGACARR